MAYLRVVDHADDDEALRRIVNLPRRHLGRQTMRTVEELRDDERRSGSRISTWQAMELAIEQRAVKRCQSRALGDFRGLIERLRTRRHEPVCDVIERVANETGYLRMVSEMDPDVAEDKQNNIAELIACEPAARLHRPLRTNGRPPGRRRRDGHHVLMTLHGAKGQEFDLVP